jgi:hypothetical protein
VSAGGGLLAKRYACPPESETITVHYELIPAQSEHLAKRYASSRVFKLIPVSYNDNLANFQSCKEITRETLPGASVRAGLCQGPSP